jgi:hypothetical protein
MNANGKLSKIDKCMSFDGMTSVGGLALMDIFLERAVSKNPEGALIEFGTYKGRTAALFSQYASINRPFHAVEQSDYLDIERLRSITPFVDWHKVKSELFCKDQLFSVLGKSGVIATHHDASHFFDNVATELEAIGEVLLPAGVIILDDFNDVFSQFRASYYYLRYSKKFPYEVLLIGFNKCILVHQDAFDSFEKYVLDSILSDLNLYNLNCTLIRSDIHEKSRGFFVKTKSSSTEGDRYGTSFWGDRFYQTASDYLSK